MEQIRSKIHISHDFGLKTLNKVYNQIVLKENVPSSRELAYPY